MTQLTTVCNETPAAGNGTFCPVCGDRIQRAATGRSARFCSAAHRIRHHRNRRREAVATKGSDVRSLSAPDLVPTTLQGAAGREHLADALEELSTLPGVTALRHLAQRAVELEMLLETIEAAIPAASDTDMDSTLWALCEHRDQISRIAELDDLADTVAEFNRAVRSARRAGEELQSDLMHLETDGLNAEDDDM